MLKLHLTWGEYGQFSKDVICESFEFHGDMIFFLRKIPDTKTEETVFAISTSLLSTLEPY